MIITLLILLHITIAIIGVSGTQPSRFDAIQKVVTQLCYTSFVLLWRCRHATAVGLLLTLLDDCCRELQQTFYPDFSTSHSTKATRTSQVGQTPALPII